jgi:threonine dehydrogenase-like Zn-dependent dehydrogenase
MIPVRGFEGKTVAVFGLGRTGLTAARALVAGGAKVALWDEKPASRAGAEAEGFKPVDLRSADWSQFAALMLSPGVPLTHPQPHWTVKMAKDGRGRDPGRHRALRAHGQRGARRTSAPRSSPSPAPTASRRPRP